ncbi:hypothetical protein LJC57_01315 [Parabacteroides sp. OttesenSCG-928-G07]|nr:hypothetical protein [Parabacteroides sp. OttesenSCG-928-G07]
MELHDFDYNVKFAITSPEITNKQNGYYKYHLEDEVDLGDGFGFTVLSEIVADVNGLNSYPAKSAYFVPKKQKFNISKNYNLIVAELMYQHLCRHSMVIYAESRGDITMKIPTIKKILDHNNALLN